MSPGSAAEIVTFSSHAKPVPRERSIEATGQAVTGVTIITNSTSAGRASGWPN